MRKILFRGKRCDNSEWIEGSLMQFKGVSCIMPIQEQDYPDSLIFLEVTTETVGQYTGLNDILGVKIFEGDVLNYRIRKNQSNWAEKASILEKGNEITVIFKDGAFVDDWTEGNISEIREKLEVIGKIHDNPELLDR